MVNSITIPNSNTLFFVLFFNFKFFSLILKESEYIRRERLNILFTT